MVIFWENQPERFLYKTSVAVSHSPQGIPETDIADIEVYLVKVGLQKYWDAS